MDADPILKQNEWVTAASTPIRRSRRRAAEDLQEDLVYPSATSPSCRILTIFAPLDCARAGHRCRGRNEVRAFLTSARIAHDHRAASRPAATSRPPRKSKAHDLHVTLAVRHARTASTSAARRKASRSACARRTSAWRRLRCESSSADSSGSISTIIIPRCRSRTGPRPPSNACARPRCRAARRVPLSQAIVPRTYKLWHDTTASSITTSCTIITASPASTTRYFARKNEAFEPAHIVVGTFEVNYEKYEVSQPCPRSRSRTAAEPVVMIPTCSPHELQPARLGTALRHRDAARPRQRYDRVSRSGSSATPRGAADPGQSPNSIWGPFGRQICTRT